MSKKISTEIVIYHWFFIFYFFIVTTKTQDHHENGTLICRLKERFSRTVTIGTRKNFR